MAMPTAWTASNHLAIDWLTVPVLVTLLPCCHCLGHHAGRLPSDCFRVNMRAWANGIGRERCTMAMPTAWATQCVCRIA